MRRIIIPSSSPTSTFELILIPLEPIRESWVKRYRLMEKKLEKLKREWQLFEENANPHYQKWYYSTFADDLSKLTDWNERAREQESILRGIVAHQRLYHLDELEAYARVKERLRLKLGPYPDAADIERYEKEQRERADRERIRREAAREKRRLAEEKFWASEAEANAYSADLEEAFEKIFSNDESAGAGDGENSRSFNEKPKESIRDKKQDDIRDLYRSIVRELHPDTGHQMTDVEKEWWNQAQVAYRKSDLETLKLLALRIQGQGRVEIDQVTHIGTLIELCTALYEQQEQIERQKKRLKRDPIYRFWMSRARHATRDKLTFETRAHLQTQLRRLRDFVAEVKSRLNELEQLSSQYVNEEEAFDPRERRRAQLGGSGRGRGRGRGR
jgi:hypothetical protein